MIEVTRKIIYGRPCYYPSNDLSSAICEMLQRKAFSEKHLEIFKNHHIDVEIEEGSDGR